MTNLRNNEEWELKRAMQGLINEGVIHPETPANLHQRIKEFINTRYTYFKENVFQHDELNTLYEIGGKVATAVSAVRFMHYKQLLLGQLEAYKK